MLGISLGRSLGIITLGIILGKSVGDILGISDGTSLGT